MKIPIFIVTEQPTELTGVDGDTITDFENQILSVYKNFCFGEISIEIDFESTK
jgi:hypothetical protein